jgi:hypothetical protein
MDIQHGDHYWTTFVEDLKEGFAGFRLHRERFGRSAVVGQTIFWDAAGGFVFGTFDGEDVPVEVVEAAIAEAREKIKTK